MKYSINETIIYESANLEQLWQDILERNRLSYLMNLDEEKENQILNSKLVKLQVTTERLAGEINPFYALEFHVQFHEDMVVPFKMTERLDYDRTGKEGYLGVGGRRMNERDIIDRHDIEDFFAPSKEFLFAENIQAFKKAFIQAYKELAEHVQNENNNTFTLAPTLTTFYISDEDLPF